MQSILALLKRYSNVLLFLVLQGICFVLLVSYNNYHRATFLNSSRSLSGWLYEMQSGVTDYFSLRSENEQLMLENARLKQQLFGNDSTIYLEWKMKKDTTIKRQYQYLPAKVIKSTTIYQKNHLTINVGTNNGIDPNRMMGVVGPKGIVGITRKGATGNYTNVISLLHSLLEINVEHAPSGQRGKLIWAEEDDRTTCTVTGFSDHINLANGDRVITSGADGRFPQGELVGIVQSFELIPGTHNYRAKINLFTDFNSVHNVHVIRNIEALEMDTLEANLELVPKVNP